MMDAIDICYFEDKNRSGFFRKRKVQEMAYVFGQRDQIIAGFPAASRQTVNAILNEKTLVSFDRRVMLIYDPEHPE